MFKENIYTFNCFYLKTRFSEMYPFCTHLLNWQSVRVIMISMVVNVPGWNFLRLQNLRENAYLTIHSKLYKKTNVSRLNWEQNLYLETASPHVLQWYYLYSTEWSILILLLSTPVYVSSQAQADVKIKSVVINMLIIGKKKKIDCCSDFRKNHDNDVWFYIIN